MSRNCEIGSDFPTLGLSGALMRGRGGRAGRKPGTMTRTKRHIGPALVSPFPHVHLRTLDRKAVIARDPAMLGRDGNTQSTRRILRMTI